MIYVIKELIPIHDPVLIFSIVMLNVLIAPILSKKLKLSGIIGLILSGIIFGPHLFGILERDRTIELLGTIGLLCIMFQAGLEINLGEVKKNKHYSIIFGLLTFFVPLILGILGAYYILNINIMSSILLASMFSSHTLLTFPIASKMGLVKKRSVSSTIGGTIITDTLALLILAVIVKANQGNLNFLFWIKLSTTIIIYTFGVFIILPLTCRWFFKKYSSDDGKEEYVFVIATLFISAYLAHIAGLEPIIGAFLAGLSLNTLIPEKSILMNRIHFVGNSLFVPFFLISVGMIIDPKAFISDIYTLKVSFVMIITAIFSKYIAALLFGKIVKFTKAEMKLIFGLSVNQAAATLAAVLVGHKVGIFNESILAGTILMIMVTCFIGALFTEKASKEVFIEMKQDEELKVNKINDRILISIKNPNTINHLTDLAFYIHDKTTEDPIYPLNVVLEGPDIEKNIIAGENLLTKVIVRASGSNKNIIPLNRIDTNISNAIIKTAKEQRVSKVIFGWDDSSNFKYRLFNTVIEQFIKNSNEMVFISKILYPIDISQNIILIIPPLINKQSGFIETINTVIKLSKEINDKLIIVSEERTIEELKKILLKIGSIKIEYLNIDNWKNILILLEKTISKNDIIMQIIARQGHIAWRPSFDKLPYQLSEKYPENSIITVYPYYSEDEITEFKKEDVKAENILLSKLDEKSLLLNFKEEKVEKVFEKIIKNNIFLDENEVLNLLKKVIEESPIELADEILLIHIHTEQIENYKVYIAKDELGFIIKNLKTKYKILIILIVPKEEALKQHLLMLSEIAKMAMNNKFKEALIKSENYKHFLKNIENI